MKFKKPSYQILTTSLLLLLGSFPSIASAKDAVLPGTGPRDFGLGIVIGEPTGLSAKLWTAPLNAIDFGLAFSFNDYALLFSDYLFHFPGSLGRSSPFVTQLTPYVGIGAVIAFANDRDSDKDRKFFGRGRDTLGLGVRVPLGIEWMPPNPRLGVFIELVPGISLVPSTSGFIEGGIGVRYYF